MTDHNIEQEKKKKLNKKGEKRKIGEILSQASEQDTSKQTNKQTTTKKVSVEDPKFKDKTKMKNRQPD